MVVYRLACMKKSGNRLFQCPDFVIHYSKCYLTPRTLVSFIAGSIERTTVWLYYYLNSQHIGSYQMPEYIRGS